MKQYDSYKDSGVEWIGKVPSHWEIVPLKFTGKFGNGLTYSPKDVVDYGILVLRSSNIQKSSLSFEDNVYVSNVSKALLVQKGDVIICSRNGSAALVGKSAFIDKDINATFGAFMMRYIPKINKKYGFYLFQTAIGRYKGYFATTTINQLTKGTIGEMKVPLANTEEQTAIVDFLDKKCSEIDNVISAQQKRIALLQELKQSVITHAVTKGLDPNVVMKDSGVEWIGEVPSHWDVAPVKRYANIFTGNTPSTKEEKYYDSEDINWFTPVDFYKDCLRESTRRISEISRKENACRIFPSKSVYMIGIGGTIGKIATCEEEASANQQINVIVPNANTDYRYLAYCMRCQKEEIMLSANVVTLPIINQEKTGFLFMPHPRKTVQITIADYLDKKCASIDASISKAQHQVDLLQEYKQSLITEVVIGKRKVC